MSQYQLLLHKDFEHSLRDLPPTTQRKTVWAQVLLGTRGRTPNVKGTMGRNARWRRTPVQGNHYYMWWIPKSESPFSNDSNGSNGSNGSSQTNGHSTGHSNGQADSVNTILVHSVRHHDETDQPIRIGDLDDYSAVPVDSLDPRYEEQREISEYLDQDELSVATIKGLPGSGKTVALLYLLKDLLTQPGQGQILYVTYTSRLKRAAQEFIDSQYVGDQLSRVLNRVRIVTLNEVLRDITGLSTVAEPFAELGEFYTFLDKQNPADLGPWRNYPRTLFTEIRAFLLGQNFPESYDWARNNRGGGAVDLRNYAIERGIDFEAAEIAGKMADRVRHMRFFRDQVAANRALAQLIQGKTPEWLSRLDALVIDEVQDLTLLQIAFLSEMVRVRARLEPDHPLRFAVAGDESQIVQPSGFDWGMTKYMLGEQLDVWPDEFNFEYQRRSPDNLADLIDNSWYLYARLPKQLRPSARSQRALNSPGEVAANQGNIFLCKTPTDDDAWREIHTLEELYTAGEHDRPASLSDEELPQSVRLWSALLTEIAERPGRAVVDLTETLRRDSRAGTIDGADETIFLPREIKGLERATILIHGLNDTYLQAIELCDDSGDGNIPRFEARRLFDEIRVALSRSTDNLVLLEPADAPILQALDIELIDGVLSVGWADLIETLQNEEMSELEAVEGYLLEVEDLFEREKWSQALARNRRAHVMAERMGDRALQREADIQYVSGILLQADTLFYRDRWREAYDRNREAEDFASHIHDDSLRRRIDDQHESILAEAVEQVQRQIDKAIFERNQKQFEQAYEHAKTAYGLATIFDDPKTQRAAMDAVTDTCWQWAGHLVDSSDSEATSLRVASLIDESAQLIDEAEESGATALRILARRYATVPQRHDLNDEQVIRLLEFARQFMDAVTDMQAERILFAHVQRWLTDAFGSLGERFPLYYDWSSTAGQLATLADDPTYRPRVIQLEQRLETIFDRAGQLGSLWDDDEDLARFRALAAGVHGRHEEASESWEAMGDLVRAAEQARQGGEMERAYQLLRTAKAPISEDLATTIKFLRLLDQLEHKHYDYSENERKMLQSRLDALRASIETDS